MAEHAGGETVIPVFCWECGESYDPRDVICPYTVNHEHGPEQTHISFLLALPRMVRWRLN